MSITVGNIETALRQLGGKASLRDIYLEVEAVASGSLPRTARHSIRARLQENCAESTAYKGSRDLFVSVYGLKSKRGVWALKELWPREKIKKLREDDGRLEKANRSKKTTAHNPIWSRDEIILALALYQINPASPPSKDSVAVSELSAILNKMHRLARVAGQPTLRNASGVYLKMMNLRALDPTFIAQGKVGMRSGGKLEKVVWAEYEGDKASLAAAAKIIRDTVNAADEMAVAKLPSAEPYEGEEGGVVMRLHKRYERDPKLVAKKRQSAAAAGKLACEVCSFDFEAIYGELGAGYIEVHHTKPVHSLLAGTKTKLSDLALLCANCHRMAHRYRQPTPISAIAAALR